jgi:hypothetical protein
LKTMSIVMAFFLLVLSAGILSAGSDDKYPPPPQGQKMTSDGAAVGDSQNCSFCKEEKIADLFLVRPIAFVGYIAGIGISLVATPFALATGKTRAVYKTLLDEPFDFTFFRPLGEFPEPSRN